MINKRISKRKLFLFVGDIFLLILSLELAHFIRLKRSIRFLNFPALFVLIILISFYIISFYIFDFYNVRLNFKSFRFFVSVLGSLTLVFLLVIVSFYILPFKLGRGIFLISLFLTGIFTVFWRIIYSDFFQLARQRRNILIIGSRRAAEAVYSIIKKNTEYIIKGMIDDTPKKKEYTRILNGSYYLEELTSLLKIDDIVLSANSTRSIELKKALVNCRMKGINIFEFPKFYEYLTFKLPVSYLNPSWFLYCEGFDKLGNRLYRKLKRLIDLMIASVVLLISLPIAAFACLAIKLNSRGPFFYIQERLGERHKLFMLFKFRTMVVDAEKGRPQWAEERDSRVTKIGRLLRKTRLDELPQLVNIIKGEMSIIGPRPEREYFVKRLLEEIPFYSLRFYVKPGLTGWAQVNYRYGASTGDALEKLQYDLFYVKNMSLFLDLRILLRTIRICMFGNGR